VLPHLLAWICSAVEKTRRTERLIFDIQAIDIAHAWFKERFQGSR
jgi:hypothetical protein